MTVFRLFLVALPQTITVPLEKAHRSVRKLLDQNIFGHLNKPTCSLYLWEQLKEAEGLLVGLGQGNDGAASAPRAAEKHTLATEAPHGVAARVQAAGLPTCRSASPFRQRVPAQADGAAPVDPKHPAGHPAEICRHPWTGTEGRRKLLRTVQVTERDQRFWSKLKRRRSYNRGEREDNSLRL